MKNSIRFFIGFSLLVLIGCYSCGVENSEAEMKAAQQAMDNAKSLHAEDLATSNWNEAMQAWDQGQAAVKEGKPAKTFFIRAKSRFDKTATIAKAHRDEISKEISDMQVTINERYAKVKTALEGGKLASRVQKQIKPIAAEVEAGNTSINDLVSQGDYLKARATAREVQKKVYNAELILAGKKPAS
jgi:hypothetical protein